MKIKNGYFTVVEPQHEMYLNKLSKVLSVTRSNVEPQHEMYLNRLLAVLILVSFCVEPQHEMYLNESFKKQTTTISEG